MDWVVNVAQKAKDKVQTETNGVTSKREKAKIVGSLLTKKVVNSAHSAHDHIKQKQHSQKLRKLSSEDNAGEASQSIVVQAIAAADLCEQKTVQTFATCDAYCIMALGRVGETWTMKKRRGSAATKVVPRQRHPRWIAEIAVPVFAGISETPELTVRVMDSKTVVSDKPLGEVCVDLRKTPSGAGSYRLLGGGFASLSLRWTLHTLESEAASNVDLLGLTDEPHSAKEASNGSQQTSRPAAPFLPEGTSEFEQALIFWTSHAGESPDNVSATFAEALKTKESDIVNELIIQAPLAALLKASPSVTTDLLQSFGFVLQRLRPQARARVAGALAQSISRRGSGSMQGFEENFLQSLFMSSGGLDLVELKRLIDMGGKYGDLSQLVYRTISNERLRDELLTHFSEEGKRLSSNERPLHVVSDIDMTVWVGTFGVGGPKFPQGPIPGALPLFRALGGRITFLSARPPVWEGQTRRALLDDVGIAEATVILGDLSTTLQSTWRKDGKQALGAKKTEGFENYSTLHPEAKFIFFGDSGEGDVNVAIRFIQSRETNGHAALIHDVVDETGLIPKTVPPERARLLDCGVVVFDTYVGAARALFAQGLLSVDGLLMAAQGCHDEFEEIPASEFRSPTVYRARRQELVRELENVNDLLSEAGSAIVEVRLCPEEEAICDLTGAGLHLGPAMAYCQSDQSIPGSSKEERECSSFSFGGYPKGDNCFGRQGH